LPLKNNKNGFPHLQKAGADALRFGEKKILE